jgi:hypothetical protein
VGGRHLPPDYSRGDETTIGGYMAVHDRPAAFEGFDGMSYSVSIETDETGDPAAPFGAYILFVRWGRGEPSVAGHLETDFLARGASADAVRATVGALPLQEVKRLLDGLIRERQHLSTGGHPSRPWWEAMRDEDGGEGEREGGEGGEDR